MGTKKKKNDGWSVVPSKEKQNQQRSSQRKETRSNKQAEVQQQNQQASAAAQDLAWRTWRPRTPSNRKSEKVGLLEKPSLGMLQLLLHYPWIVYMGYSLWRRLVILVSPPESYPSALLPRLRQVDSTSEANLCTVGRSLGLQGHLKHLHKLLPKEFMLAPNDKPLAPSRRPWLSLLSLQQARKRLQDAIKLFQGGTRQEMVARREQQREAVPVFRQDFGEFFYVLIENNQRDVLTLMVRNLRIELSSSWGAFEGASACNPHRFASDHRYPLHVAAENGHQSLVKLFDLYSLGAIDATVPFITRPTTALTTAIRKGDTGMTRFLIEQCAADVMVPKEFTPLACAVISGDLEVARLLLNHGADVKGTAGGGGDEALVRAVNLYLEQTDYPVEMIKLLLDLGADKNVLGLWATPQVSAEKKKILAAMLAGKA